MIIPQLTDSGSVSQAPQVRPPGSNAPSAATASPSPQQVEHAVEQIRQVVTAMAQNLRFSIDQGSGKTVIRVVDTQTKEVVRQIPTEEALSLSQALGRMHGLLLNGKA